MRLRCDFVDKWAVRVSPRRSIPCYGQGDVRRLRVVAGVALIAILALVAVPGSVGSRGPSPAGLVDPGLFRPVDVQSLTRGTPTTVLPPDPGARSAGTLDEGSMFIEPSSRTGPPAAPFRDAQPAAEVGVIIVPPPTPKPDPTPAPVAKAAPKPAAKAAARKSSTSAPRVATTTSSGGWRLDPNVSWYGPGFYGHGTACGQTLTRGLIGVAHKTLPCGTKILFRNPSNGKTLLVPVVDRGPYVAGRNWDLTAGTCLALGHCYTGSIQWKFAG
jgi:hypothetical protein